MHFKPNNSFFNIYIYIYQVCFFVCLFAKRHFDDMLRSSSSITKQSHNNMKRVKSMKLKRKRKAPITNDKEISLKPHSPIKHQQQTQAVQQIQQDEIGSDKENIENMENNQFDDNAAAKNIAQCKCSRSIYYSLLCIFDVLSNMI